MNEIITKLMKQIDWSEYEYIEATTYFGKDGRNHIIYYKHRNKRINIEITKRDMSIWSFQVYDFEGLL